MLRAPRSWVPGARLTTRPTGPEKGAFRDSGRFTAQEGYGWQFKKRVKKQPLESGSQREKQRGRRVRKTRGTEGEREKVKQSRWEQGWREGKERLEIEKGLRGKERNRWRSAG